MNNRRQFLRHVFGVAAGPVDADLSLDRLDPNAKGQMGMSGHVFPPMTATQVLESHRRLDMHRKKLDEEMRRYGRACFPKENI